VLERRGNPVTGRISIALEPPVRRVVGKEKALPEGRAGVTGRG